MFFPIPSQQTDVARQEVVNTNSQVDKWELSFGMKLDTEIPTDTYTNQVIITIVANPLQVKGMESITYMQEVTSDICANTAEHVSKTLIDSRDNKSYQVTKLKDGNCWMTENLALTSQSMITVKGDSVLTPIDSDVEEDWTLPETNLTVNTANTTTNDNNYISSWNVNNGYGTYFTFNAVTAGKSAAITSNQANVENNSVCPKNWKLPTAGSNFTNKSGSFYYLLNFYSATACTYNASDTIQAEPLNFKMGGLIYADHNGGELYNVGGRGDYCSSISYNTSNVYYLSLFKNCVYPNDNYAAHNYQSYRTIGRSVRCLAR